MTDVGMAAGRSGSGVACFALSLNKAKAIGVKVSHACTLIYIELVVRVTGRCWSRLIVQAVGQAIARGWEGCDQLLYCSPALGSEVEISKPEEKA